VAPWPVAWIDPAAAIARRVRSVLVGEGEEAAGDAIPPADGLAVFTSGRAAEPALARLLAAHGLHS